MDGDYPIPDMKTIFQNSHEALYLTSEMLTIKLNFTKRQKIHAQSTHLRDLKQCRLSRGSKNSSSIFQNCIKSPLKGIKGVVIFQDDVLELTSSSSTGKCQSRVDYVRKVLLLMRKSLTENHSIALVFWDTPFQRKE